MPTVHLISNAHLDPVWAWAWDEGLVEAIATFRIAAEMLEKYPEYVFIRGESILYEWVEKHDPPLFKKISALIRAGRWIIVGGWYLQPDCNIPGGESFVRQAMVGKAYFLEKFGIEPLVAYNVDSFGHNAGLPQILQKSGSRFYIHFRPDPHEKTLPEVYRWRGVDGTEVITSRPVLAGYCTEPGTAPEKIRKGIQRARESGQDVILFWGVGDHGGGATRAELGEIRAIAAETSDVQVKHSHPAAFFDVFMAQNADLPVVADELQRSFSGCYTSAAAVKRAHRLAEGLLAQAERLAALASVRVGWEYPQEELSSAWKDLLFNQFHDSLAGTTSKPAMQDLLDIFGRCHQAARKIRLGAALALAAAEPAVTAAIPIYVFNPHAQAFSGPVEADFMLEYRPPDWTGMRLPVEVTAANGQPVPSQEGVSTLVFPLDWRKKLHFWAEVPPLSCACFLVRRVETPAQATAGTISETESSLSIETAQLSIHFDRVTGALTQLTDRHTHQDYLTAAGIEALVMNDAGDSWGSSIASYRDLAGKFTPASAEVIARLTGKTGQLSAEPALKLIENGPLRIIVDSLLAYGASSLLARYTFYAHTNHFDLTFKILWNEPNHMLKLAIPSTLNSPQIRSEVSYGAILRPADGSEYPAQRWTLLEDADRTLGLVNTGQYGYDALDGELRLSLLRSPQYSALIANGQIAQLERTPDFIDIGPHEIHLSIYAGPTNEALPAIIRLAQQKNIPAVVLPYFQASIEHASAMPIQPQPAYFAVEPSTVVLGALKKAEDGKGLIIRLHESAGKHAEAKISFATAEQFPLSFSPFEIKSMRWQDGTLSPCDLLERPVQASILDK